MQKYATTGVWYFEKERTFLIFYIFSTSATVFFTDVDFKRNSFMT